MNVSRRRRSRPPPETPTIAAPARPGHRRAAWPGSIGRSPREVVERIRRVHRDSRQVYGSPRVHRALEAEGVACCENTVAELMRRAGVRAATSRRFVVRTTDSRHGHAVADNGLGRRFDPGEVDKVWVGDITYVATGEGWLYLAAVLDLGSRKSSIIAWRSSISGVILMPARRRPDSYKPSRRKSIGR
jgi:transposase InsO family protein